MNEMDRQKQEEECRKIIAAEERQIVKALDQAGVLINDIDELELRHSGERQIKAIPILLEQVEKKYHSYLKEVIYRGLACANWLKGELLTEVIDTLFRQFENDNMLFTHCNIDGAMEFLLTFKDYEGAKSMDEISAIKVRWAIGLAIDALINHKLASHKKYQQRIHTLLKNKKYRKGRSELVLTYARLAGQEAIPDLIDLLEGGDSSVLGRTIEALGKLKAKEAKSHLERLLKHEDKYFRDLARKALKKID